MPASVVPGGHAARSARHRSSSLDGPHWHPCDADVAATAVTHAHLAMLGLGGSRWAASSSRPALARELGRLRSGSPVCAAGAEASRSKLASGALWGGAAAGAPVMAGASAAHHGAQTLAAVTGRDACTYGHPGSIVGGSRWVTCSSRPALARELLRGRLGGWPVVGRLCGAARHGWMSATSWRLRLRGGSKAGAGCIVGLLDGYRVQRYPRWRGSFSGQAH
jgi:hypothetical protein